MASTGSSASLTRTSIAVLPAAIAASTRRLPALITSVPSTVRTTGGWMMPTARMEAISCSSIAVGTGVRRGLSGFGIRLAGSMLRNSVMMGSLFGLPSVSLCFGETPFPAASRRPGQGRSRRSRARPQAARPLPRPPAMRHSCPAQKRLAWAVSRGGAALSAGAPACIGRCEWRRRVLPVVFPAQHGEQRAFGAVDFPPLAARGRRRADRRRSSAVGPRAGSDGVRVGYAGDDAPGVRQVGGQLRHARQLLVEFVLQRERLTEPRPVVAQPRRRIRLTPCLLFQPVLEAVEHVFEPGDQPQCGQVVAGLDLLVVAGALQDQRRRASCAPVRQASAADLISRPGAW